MKTNKGLPNRCIGDNNIGYNTKREKNTTSMSDMNELSEIAQSTTKKFITSLRIVQLQCLRNYFLQ